MRARAYLDYNATAPIRPEVKHAIEPILFGETEAGEFGNPSSIHWAGQAARKRLETARTSVARAFGRKPSEVIFTSGGSEADNLALLGTRKMRIAISAVEHPAVMEAARRLERNGTHVERIPVDREGRLDLDALDTALASGLELVSVMAVNNETGILSPIDEVIRRAHRSGTLVHVDAVQAIGRTQIPEGADLLSISGHKLGGLKGTGALIVREHVPIAAAILGGPQERGRRAGTESVAGAVALSVALDLALAEQPVQMARLGRSRDRIDAVLDAIPGTLILGRSGPRAAQTTCAVFERVDGDAVLQALDLEGIAASSGSACSSGSLEPSHVLSAMGIEPRRALSAVRFSLGWATDAAEIDYLASVLPSVVAQVRGTPKR